jgi:TPR repeat protein
VGNKLKSRKNNKLFVEANSAWDGGNLLLAYELFLRAAQSGDMASQLDLGYFFDCGLHVKKDKKKALYWYYQAYRQGDPSAANNIATIHRDCGRIGRMIWWFRRAVRMGDPEPLLEIGECYETGIGLVRNLKKAQDCYHRILNSDRVSEFYRDQARKRLSKLQKQEKRSTAKAGSHVKR